MRIAVFIKNTTFHKGFGGLEVQNKILCEGLAAKGHDIVVFAPKRDLTNLTASENMVSYIFVDCSYRYFLSTINPSSWYNKAYKIFLQEHNKKPFDIVLSQSSAGIPIIDRKNSLDIKVISIAHGSALGELKTYLRAYFSFKHLLNTLRNLQYALRQYFGRQRSYILHSNKIIAVSNAVKNQLLAETFAPADHIVVINNGMFKNVDSGQKFNEKAALVFVGQLTEDKGADLLLNLVKKLSATNVNFYIMGDGPMYVPIKQYVADNLLQDKVRVLGKLKVDDTQATLKNLKGSVFLFPTKRVEGLPMVLIEALFNGLIPVAFNLGGVGDAVQNGENGFLIDENNTQEFFAKVDLLLNDANLRGIMSDKAVLTAVKKFRAEDMILKYENLIKEVNQI